ncbi:MAG: DUF2283 domain-containing protein [Microcystaceae cyanobacterium]
MQTIAKETLKQERDRLNDEQLQQLADFIAFLKFQSKLSQPKPDLNQLAHLYQEFANEDRELAEMGMSEYTKSLKNEEVNVYYDLMGNTLTVWFGDRSSEYLCEETGDEVILMKNQQGEVIGFEKLNYTISANTNLKISLETAIAT